MGGINHQQWGGENSCLNHRKNTHQTEHSRPLESPGREHLICQLVMGVSGSSLGVPKNGGSIVGNPNQMDDN